MFKNKDRVIVLEDLLGETEECCEYIKLVDEYVKNILFSRYPLRKEIAQRELNELWGSEVKFSNEIVNENIFAYIQIKEIPNKFIVVGIYPLNLSIIESSPDEEELEYWKECLSPN